MIKGKVSRPARQFVESYLGRGTAAGKITTNPNTAARKILKGISIEQGRYWPELEEFKEHARGATIRDAPKTKNGLVYLRKARKSAMLAKSPFYRRSATDELSQKAQDALVLSHELFHRAFHNKYLRTHKCSPPEVLGELISNLGSLSYLGAVSEMDYRKYLAEFDDSRLADKIKGIESLPGSQLGQKLAISRFGQALAIVLHKKLPAEAKRPLIEELAESNIRTGEDAKRWVNEKLAQRRLD